MLRLFTDPVFYLGFCPFYLLAGIFATLVIPLWLAMFAGPWPALDSLGPVGWDAHGYGVWLRDGVIAVFFLCGGKRGGVKS